MKEDRNHARMAAEGHAAGEQTACQMENLAGAMAITRSPARCMGCGQQLGEVHAPGCALAQFTTGATP